MLHTEHESGNTDIDASSLNRPQFLQEKGRCEEIPKYVSLPTEVGDSSFMNPIDPDLKDFKQPRALMCMREGTCAKAGNYVAYRVHKNFRMLFLDLVYTNYCQRPKVPFARNRFACSCTELLTMVLNAYPEVNQVEGYFVAKPWEAGCKCYLNSAARAGYRYVDLRSPNPDCKGPKAFNVENYSEICLWYRDNKCVENNDPRKNPVKGFITKNVIRL